MTSMSSYSPSGFNDPDIVLSFAKFIYVYKSPEPMWFHKKTITVDIGGTTIELYSYELFLAMEDGSRPLFIVHPDHVSAGLDAYMDFMVAMMYAASDKYSTRWRRIVANGRGNIQPDGNDERDRPGDADSRRVSRDVQAPGPDSVDD